MNHKLKTHPKYFKESMHGNKPFEIRKDDRDYQAGHTITLQEWQPDEKIPMQGEYTGREVTRLITYVLRDATEFGLTPGFCIIGLATNWASEGVSRIYFERMRQVEEEGYNPSRDNDAYKAGELAGAAACYAVNAVNKIQNRNFIEVNEIGGLDAWPLDAEYDKREKHDEIRSLEIAGALIAAQIDLLTGKPITIEP